VKVFEVTSALCQRGRRMLKFKEELNGTQVEGRVQNI
jgi:hypothetical protein